MKRSGHSRSRASSEAAQLEAAAAEYRSKGLAGRVGFGNRPAVLVVDFLRGFTDPTSPLGAPLDDEVRATARLLDAAREAAVPVLFAVTRYQESLADAGLFVAKVPALEILRRGSAWTELDPRLDAHNDDILLEKQYASAFFGTSLSSTLTALAVDTVILAGCTTSGCIRATAVDALQNGFRAIVARQCVGDRNDAAHEANLFDIDAKYGDVVTLEDALAYLAALERTES